MHIRFHSHRLARLLLACPLLACRAFICLCAAADTTPGGLNAFQLQNRIEEAKLVLAAAEHDLREAASSLKALRSAAARKERDHIETTEDTESLKTAANLHQWCLSRRNYARNLHESLLAALAAALQDTPEAKAERALQKARQNLREKKAVLRMLKAAGGLSASHLSQDALDNAKRQVLEAEDDVFDKTKALRQAQFLTRQMQLNAHAEAEAMELARQTATDELHHWQKSWDALDSLVQRQLRQETSAETPVPSVP